MKFEKKRYDGLKLWSVRKGQKTFVKEVFEYILKFL